MRVVSWRRLRNPRGPRPLGLIYHSPCAAHTHRVSPRGGTDKPSSKNDMPRVPTARHLGNVR